MKTSEIVAHLCRLNSDWQVPTILMYINEVQKQMLGKPLKSREIIDPATGKHPVVTLVDGVFSYVLSKLNGFPENAICADKVYTQNGESVRCRFIDATASSYAIIQTPPDVNCPVFVQAYKKPNEIKMVQHELEIPEEFHMSHVVFGVQAMLEEAEYGESNKTTVFEKKVISFRRQQNWDADPVLNSVEPYYHGQG